MNQEQAFQRLAHAGVVERQRGEWRTTQAWERAFMRAEGRVLEFNEGVGGPRLPIAYALVDMLGPDLPDIDLEAMVEALLPLEQREEQQMVPALEPELEG